jgi:serine protease Do
MHRTKLLSAAIAAALLGAGATFYVSALPAHAIAPLAAAQQSTLALPDFTQLVERVSPAVVSVYVSRTAPAGLDREGPWTDKNDPFFQFFRRFGVPEQIPRRARGEGSGFVIDPGGRIMTNAHVVAGADRVTVRLSDKREFDAKVIGQDQRTDVAVLKIDASDLPTLEIGDPNALKVGEWVIAIGSPFGLERTVTAGVVSAKSRTLPDGSSVPFIQSDVAVNFGNSGGPLVNLRGEVVGINSQIYSSSGGYMGLSFAVPIDLAMNVGSQLVEFGKVTRGRLGVFVQSVDQGLADSFGLDRPRGALISKVEQDSPAEKAGLRPGDIILSVNGEEIDESAELSRIIAGHKPGSTVELRLMREGKEREVKAEVSELEPNPVAGAAGGDSVTGGGRLGVTASELDPQTKQELNRDGGVLVRGVTGAAAEAGIRIGDIILAVNAQPVRSPEELKRIIDKAPQHIALLVLRDDTEIFVPITLN